MTPVGLVLGSALRRSAAPAVAAGGGARLRRAVVRRGLLLHRRDLGRGRGARRPPSGSRSVSASCRRWSAIRRCWRWRSRRSTACTRAACARASARRAGLDAPDGDQAALAADRAARMVTSVRRLLDGEEVTPEGRCFSFDRVRLASTRHAPCRVYMGVLGPKMMQLSGEIADGNVLSVLSSRASTWARERARRRREAARNPGRRRSRSCPSAATARAEARPARADGVLPRGRSPQRADRRLRHRRRARGDGGARRAASRRARDARRGGSTTSPSPASRTSARRRSAACSTPAATRSRCSRSPSGRSEDHVRTVAADVLPRCS